jgi:hypothetical protein
MRILRVWLHYFLVPFAVWFLLPNGPTSPTPNSQLSLVSGSLRSLAGLWRFVLTNIKNEERTELSLDSQDNKTLTAEIEKRNQLSITLGPTKSTTGSKKRKEPTGQGVRCPDPDCHIFLGRGRSNGGHIESCLFSAHYPRGVRESTHLPIARRDYTVAAIAFYNEHRMMVKERRRRVWVVSVWWGDGCWYKWRCEWC